VLKESDDEEMSRNGKQGHISATAGHRLQDEAMKHEETADWV
jgi:hypothetical protein